MHRIFNLFSSSPKKVHEEHKEPAEVSMSEAEAWYARTGTQTTDRGMEIRNARFVKDQYGRRMTRILQPNVLVEEVGTSRTRFGGLQPAPLQLVHKYGGGSNKTTPDTVIHSHISANEFSRMRFKDTALAPLQLTEKHGSGTSTNTHTMTNPHPTASDVGSRNDRVRLSHKTAVKRMSTRGNNTITEKRSKGMLSTCSLAKNPPQKTTTRSTPVSPLTPRRFSFDEDSELAFSAVHRQQMVWLSNIRGDFPTRTSIRTSTVQLYKESASIARFLSLPLPPSKEQHDILSSGSATRYHDFVCIDLSSSDLSQEVVEKKAGLQTVAQDVEVKQKRIPTTFDEILGKRNIPTALL